MKLRLILLAGFSALHIMNTVGATSAAHSAP